MINRYIANANKKGKGREFHSIARQKPQCHVNRIIRPTFYARGKHAIKDGFDPCAFCVGSKRGGQWKSKDNE